jgi:hypothetical protein
MRQIWSFIKQLSKSDSKESSKRFLALYTTLILVSYLVFRYADKDNCEIILGELLSFVLVLMGVAVWQQVKQQKKGSQIGEDEEY